MLKAAGRLTDRDRYLVRVVAEHRVLTTDQLAALAFDNIITARHRLDALTRLGALRRFRPHRATGSAPWHYLLGPWAQRSSVPRRAMTTTGSRRCAPDGRSRCSALSDSPT
jgi:hypothetical protein